MEVGLKSGHTLTGKGTGAVGIVKETDKNREIEKRFTEMLKEKGHTVINCTIDKSENDLFDSVAIANRYNLDVFIDVHLNSFGVSSANGVETYSYSTSGTSHDIAKRVQLNLVKDIGWADRGKKQANFYTLKNTKAPAIYLELGFVTNANDMNKWDTEKICRSLFKSITGEEYKSTVAEEKPDTGACDDIHRVKVDGVQVGAYRNHDSIVNVVKENIGKTIEVK